MDKQKITDICDRLAGWSFYLLAAGVTFSNAITDTATAAVIALWIIRKILDKDNTLPGKRVGLLLLLFVLWNLASFINTSYIDESIRGFIKAAKHLLIFLAALDYFKSRERLERFLLFTIGVGFIISLNGIAQHIIGIDLIRGRAINYLDYLHRISSSFTHPNDFGAYLIVILTMLFSLLFTRSRPLKERLLILIAISPVAWCLVSTSSRGAWMGFLIALLCLAMVKSKKLFAAILILILISPAILPSSIKNRFSDFVNITKESKGGTAWERMKLWSGTIAMVKEHPFLGFGINTYTRNFPAYKPKDYPDVRYTHNSYLQMASEIGITGAGIFLLFLVSVVIAAAKAIGASSNGLSRDLSLGVLCGIIGFLAHCSVDTHLYSVTLSAFLFLYLGVAFSFCDKRL